MKSSIYHNRKNSELSPPNMVRRSSGRVKLEDNRSSGQLKSNQSNNSQKLIKNKLSVINSPVVQRVVEEKKLLGAINQSNKELLEELLVKVKPGEVEKLVALGYQNMVSIFRIVYRSGVNKVNEELQGLGILILLNIAQENRLHEFASDVAPGIDFLLKSSYSLSHKMQVEPINKSISELSQVSGYFSREMELRQIEFLKDAEQKIAYSQGKSKIDRSQERFNAILNDVNFHKQRINKLFSQSKGLKTKNLAVQYIHSYEAVLVKLNNKLNFQLSHNLTLLSDPFVLDPDSRREWSEDELDSLLPVVSRLPKSHVEDNNKLKGFKRQDRYPPKPEWGAFYSYDTSEMTLTDAAFKNAHYRATGMTSELAGHDKRSKVIGKGPVSPIDEALTHEIGHSVHEKYQQQFAGFEKLAGWKLFKSVQETARFIYPDIEQKLKYEQLLSRLDKLDVGKSIEVSEQVVRRVSQTRYSVRTLGSLPTDSHEKSHADQSLFSYAQEMSKEHFAELYTHMVNIPEAMHSSYIVQPEREYHHYQKEADEAIIGKESKAKKALFYKKKMHRLRQIWELMKYAIFEVDPKPANQLVDLMKEAGIHKSIILQFIQQEKQVATPYQQNILIRKYEERFDEIFQEHHLASARKILSELPKVEELKKELRQKILQLDGSLQEKQQLLKELDAIK